MTTNPRRYASGGSGGGAGAPRAPRTGAGGPEGSDAWVERASRQPPPVPETPEELYLAEELESAVQDAILELPARCREIFLLRRRDQLPYEEIAIRAGVSLGTVKSQMWRAAGRLRKKLGFILEAPPGVVPIHAPCTPSVSKPRPSLGPVHPAS